MRRAEIPHLHPLPLQKGEAMPGLPSRCRITYLYLTEQPYGFVLDVLTDLPAIDSSSATFT